MFGPLPTCNASLWSSRQRTWRSGFSLIELIIVLVVMTGLLAIVWPNLQRPLRRSAISQAAGALRESIDQARYRALTAGQVWLVRLEVGSDTIEYGSFEAFALRDDGPLAGSGSQPASTSGDLAALPTGSATPPRTPAIQLRRLPQAVVVTAVQWHLGAATQMSDPLRDQAPYSPTDGLGAQLPQPVITMQPSMMPAVGQQAQPTDGPRVHWLPLLPSGVGRDAIITLMDPAVGESIKITYQAATGSLEIDR